jgi:hypothetical protein
MWNEEVRRQTMKPRWLLLAVSLICLLVLAPATALSQDSVPEVTAGCGTAEIDGVLEDVEWAPATRLSMSADCEHFFVENPACDAQLLLMNDETHMYVGAEMDLGYEAELGGLDSDMSVCFADEPDPLDDEFAATSCDEPPSEGCYYVMEIFHDEDFSEVDELWIGAIEDEGDCGERCEEEDGLGPGVAWAAEVASIVEWEWALDLEDSYLNKVGPGDCFRLGIELWGSADDPTDGGAMGDAWWPDILDAECYPDVFGIVCLNPCEPEVVPEPEFVPEWGSIALLGSGLMGLAGYASLRWRKR